MQEAVYSPIINTLADKQYTPKTIREISQAQPSLNWGQILQAVAILVGMGAVAPCQDENAAKAVGKRCAALNQHLFERARLGGELTYLASPVLGAGVAVNRFEQLYLHFLQAGKKSAADAAQGVWQILVQQGQKLVKEGRTLESAEDNLAELTQQAKIFFDTRVPILRALQVV